MQVLVGVDAGVVVAGDVDGDKNNDAVSALRAACIMPAASRACLFDGWGKCFRCTGFMQSHVFFAQVV